MSVISSSVNKVLANLLKSAVAGKQCMGEFTLFDNIKGKTILTVDVVESREERSEQGVDILWISFDWGVIRVNAQFVI